MAIQAPIKITNAVPLIIAFIFGSLYIISFDSALNSMPGKYAKIVTTTGIKIVTPQTILLRLESEIFVLVILFRQQFMDI